MNNTPHIIEIKKGSKESYYCDIPVTKEQWLDLLRDKGVTTSERMQVLLSFYFMPEHKASCFQCAEKYGSNLNAYSSAIYAYGKAVIKKLGTFSIMDEGEQRFGYVPMGKVCYIKENGNIQFEWQLRKDLVEAIETLLIEDAIEQYLYDLDNHWRDELYKWEAVQWFQENWDLEMPDFVAMLQNALSKTSNLLASMNSFPREMIINIAKAAPNEVRNMFINLYDESKDLAQRVQQFIDTAEILRKKHNTGSWKMHYQNTNAVSTYLWLRYPDKYYIYKYGEYLKVDEKLGLGYKIKKGQVGEMVKGYDMYDMLTGYLLKNQKLVEVIKTHVENSTELHPDTQMHTMTIDFGFWVSRFFKSAEQSLYSNTTVYMDPFISNAIDLLKNKKNIILQGAPGTGKTYNTASLAVALIDGIVPNDHTEVMDRYEQLREELRIGFTTFHQSMDYEDFIEGIKPINESGQIQYKVEDGIFKRLCKVAQASSEGIASVVKPTEKPFVLIIDEINRGNVSKIFGELITLLEKDKRIGADHPVTLSLPYSKQADFGIPQNLYVIGTMNTTDRSTGTIDYAIRRRFAFLTLPSNREVVDSEVAKSLFDNVAVFIERYKYADMDFEDLMVGHSYFMAESDGELVLKVKYEIIPLIKEYIKDGILRVRPAEAKSYFDAWLKLEILDDNDSGTSAD